MVWINVLLSRLFFRTPFEGHVLLGAALGMAGVVVLFWPSLVEAAHEGPSLTGIIISLSGAVIASLGNMASHQAQQERLPVLQSNAWGMFYGALITGLWALLTGKPFNFEFTAEYVGSLLYLSVVGSVIAFGCYLSLLGRIGPARAGYISVVVPVIAVLLSIVFEGLQLNAYIIAGFALVLGGNLLVLLFRRIRVPRRPV
jgi:drug/metabolite transporter (DMT)-like permease